MLLKKHYRGGKDDGYWQTERQHVHEKHLKHISISISSYYYHPVRRSITRLDPSIKVRIRDIASERPTYGYRRVWAMLRNRGIHVNRKTVQRVLKKNNLSSRITTQRKDQDREPDPPIWSGSVMGNRHNIHTDRIWHDLSHVHQGLFHQGMAGISLFQVMHGKRCHTIGGKWCNGIQWICSGRFGTQNRQWPSVYIT